MSLLYGADYSFLIILVIYLVPFILVLWLLIEIIRWFRRH